MKRIQELRLPSLEAYLTHIHHHPEEFAVLRRRLFVTVSKFFRDPESFEALATPLRRAMVSESGQPFTVWVAGCGTGEEVYSLAMLMHHLTTLAGIDRDLHVVGTDLNEIAVAHAVAARYSVDQVSVMPETFRTRYLTWGQGQYEVIPEIRALCRFENGDVFGRRFVQPLALVSCRNLLIYLKSQRQEALLQHMHGLLRVEGLLFLGQSESLVRASRALFTPLDIDHRLYRKRQVIG